MSPDQLLAVVDRISAAGGRMREVAETMKLLGVAEIEIANHTSMMRAMGWFDSYAKAALDALYENRMQAGTFGSAGKGQEDEEK